MRGWRHVLVLGFVGLPVLGFVFVPQRGAEPYWRLTCDEASSALLSADLDGGLYAAAPRAVVAAIAGEDGAETRWRYEASEGLTIREPVQCGYDVAVVVARPDDKRADAVVVGLAVEPDGDEAEVLWERRLPAVPEGGVYLPLDEDPEEGDLGILAALSDGALLVLDLETGELEGQRPVGTITGRPVWVEDSGFVTTSDGYRATPDGPGAPAVCGYDIPNAGRADDPSLSWVWRVPADDTIESLEWLPNSRILVGRGKQALHVFE